jgi:hypothetical protein
VAKILLCLLFAAALSGGGVAFAQDTPDDEPTSDAAPPPAVDDSGPSPATSDQWWTWRSNVNSGKAIEAQLAYMGFWDQRTQAAAHPGGEAEWQLGFVEDGAQLDHDVAYMKQLENSGQAQIIRVDTHPAVAYADDQQYVVFDNIGDHTFNIDVKTKARVGGAGDGSTLPMVFLLKKVADSRHPDGFLIKVVDSKNVVNP